MIDDPLTTHVTKISKPIPMPEAAKLPARQLAFCICVIVSSWVLMMAVHESGHVLGAIATGGKIVSLDLHPASISQTTVKPNPEPAIVVWLGPLVGCLFPVLVAVAAQQLLKKKSRLVVNSAWFFAGFCLIANGCYIGFGSISLIGDCSEMHLTGTPRILMQSFGTVVVVAGMLIWHKLGSLKSFLFDADSVSSTDLSVAISVAVATLLIPMALF